MYPGARVGGDMLKPTARREYTVLSFCRIPIIFMVVESNTRHRVFKAALYINIHSTTRPVRRKGYETTATRLRSRAVAFKTREHVCAGCTQHVQRLSTSAASRSKSTHAVTCMTSFISRSVCEQASTDRLSPWVGSYQIGHEEYDSVEDYERVERHMMVK